MRALPAFLLSAPLFAATHEVKDPASLATALRALKAGDTLRIAPGDYPPGQYVGSIPDLTIEALDPANPPHFKGGAQAWHFSRCPGLTVRHDAWTSCPRRAR